MTKIAGSGYESGSGSISQRHGSADPDPDPHQNVMNPELWKKTINSENQTEINGYGASHECHLTDNVEKYGCQLQDHGLRLNTSIDTQALSPSI